MSRGVGALGAVGALALARLLAQEPAPAPQPAPPPAVAAPVPAPAAEQARAMAILADLATAGRDVVALQAEYEQRRTTDLSAEPLVSRGTFAFVREPGAVLFHAATPRESWIRLGRTTYEVFRPAKRQLERFLLDGPDLANGLFAALAGDAHYLTEAFVVTACAEQKPEPKPEPAPPPPPPNEPVPPVRTEVVLVPKAADVRERLRELRLAVTTRAGGDGQAPRRELASIAYRDRSGDRIEIVLRHLVRNPEPMPRVTLDVPADTTVVEHRVPAGR